MRRALWEIHVLHFARATDGFAKAMSSLSRGNVPLIPQTFSPSCVDMHRNQLGTWQDVSWTRPPNRPLVTSPKGPNLEEKQSCLKLSVSLENVSLA